MTLDEDQEIRGLLDAASGDRQQTLASLYSKHRDRLRRMIEFRLDARLRGRVSTSDVLQEAYIDALKRLPHFEADPAVPFFIWLRAVTIQRLIQVHRAHLGAGVRDAAREVHIQGRTIPGASSEMIAEFIADVTSPSQVVQRVEVMSQLRGSLDHLDPIDREVLALRHFEDLSNHEVAAMLGIQPAAASKRYVRALERLKEALERLPGFAEEG